VQFCWGINSSQELTSTGTVDERPLPRQQEPAQRALPTIHHDTHWPLVRWGLLFSLPQIMRGDVPPPVRVFWYGREGVPFCSHRQSLAGALTRMAVTAGSSLSDGGALMLLQIYPQCSCFSRPMTALLCTSWKRLCLLGHS